MCKPFTAESSKQSAKLLMQKIEEVVFEEELKKKSSKQLFIMSLALSAEINRRKEKWEKKG